MNQASLFHFFSEDLSPEAAENDYEIAAILREQVVGFFRKYLMIKCAFRSLTLHFTLLAKLMKIQTLMRMKISKMAVQMTMMSKWKVISKLMIFFYSWFLSSFLILELCYFLNK